VHKDEVWGTKRCGQPYRGKSLGIFFWNFDLQVVFFSS